MSALGAFGRSRARTNSASCSNRPARTVHHARLPPPCSSKQDVVDTATSTSTSSSPAHVEVPDAGPSGRSVATFRATKLGRQPILEAQRPLAEYMALPASQYSVLDARRIERVDDSTFRCYVGELRFFSWSVEPVITVSVTVEQGGCTIRLLGCKLQGSRFVEDINDKFSATMTNVVRYQDYVPQPGEEEELLEGPADSDGDEEAVAAAGAAPSGARKQIVSDTTIQVRVEVPPWSSFLPLATIEGVGSGVMQNVLNVMVPRFLAQLRTDYQLWASGDESRRPVGEL